MIDRENLGGIIPAEYFESIFEATAEQSAILQLGKRLRNMSTKELTLTVQDSMPMAGFVNGDTGLKAVSDMKWKGIKIVAEEVAVIIPIPDNIVADAKAGKTDMWELIKPQLSAAMGKVIDNAILFGTDKPTSWLDGIVPTAVSKGNYVIQSASGGYTDIMETNGLIAKIEEDGYMANGYVSAMKARAWLRSIKTATEGIPLFRSIQDPMTGKTAYSIDGEKLIFPMNGAMEGVYGVATAKPYIVGGDFQQLVYSVREDVKYELFTEGVISDADGKVIINLMQQDTSALRVVMRLGWQLPNPINHINSSASRYPFSVFAQSPIGSLATTTITSAEGTALNDSLITVTSNPTDATFSTYWYKAGASVAAPTLGQVASTEGYTKMTLTSGAQNIAFSTATKVRVAEVDIYGRIIGVSAETTLTKKA